MKKHCVEVVRQITNDDGVVFEKAYYGKGGEKIFSAEGTSEEFYDVDAEIGKQNACAERGFTTKFSAARCATKIQKENIETRDIHNRVISVSIV